MSIGAKITAGFVLAALLMLALALYSVSVSRQSLLESVGTSSVFLTEEMLKRMDMDIYGKIESLQIYSGDLSLKSSLLASNREFESLDSIEGYVSQKDSEWVSAPKDAITPFMQALIGNELSNSLRREFIEFYEKRYGYAVFGEVFVTNEYGANVAQTGKTTDYYQADEAWWQIAKTEGLYAGDIEYDESADVYAVIIGVRVDDENGNFIGALKGVVVVNAIIRQAEIATKKYETTEIKLTTQDGRLIFATRPFQFGEDASAQGFFQKIQQSESGFFLAEEGGREKLLAYAHSRGYRNFAGFQWILIMECDVEEISQPISALRNSILAAFLVLFTTGMISASLISRSISNPIAELIETVEEIRAGRLDVEIGPGLREARDEVGDLARAFDQMARRVRERTIELAGTNELLRQEIAGHKKAEESIARQLRELTVLHAVALAGVRAASVDELIAQVTQTIGETLYPDNVGFLLRDEAQNVLRVHPSYRGVVWEKTPIVVPLTQGIVGKVASTGQPLRVPDVSLEPAYMQVAAESRSELCVPLQIGERVIGVINAESSKEDFFSEADERLLFTIAGQVATALEWLRLFESERQRRQEAETLRQAAQVVSASLDVNEVFRLMLEQFKHVLTFDTASVLLLGETGQPDLVAGMDYADEKMTSQAVHELLKDSPILKQMAQALEPLTIADVRHHPGWIWVPGAEHVRSFLAVPMIARRRMIGALMADSVYPGFFTDDDVRVAQSLAQHMAIAIENARLFKAEQRRAEETTALLATTRALSSLDLQSVLETIAMHARRLFEADGSNIHLIEPDGETLRCVVALEEHAEQVMALPLKLGQGFAGLVASKGASEIVNRTLEDTRGIQVPGTPEEPEALALAPLRWGENVIGVMTVSRLGEDRPFAPGDLTLLTAFADQAAQAIAKARLYEDARRRLAHVQTLHEIDRAIAGSMDLRLILNIILDQATTQLRVDAADVLLFDPGLQTLEFANGRGFRTSALRHTRLRLGEGYAGQAVLERRIVHIPDLTIDAEAFSRSPYLPGEGFVTYFAAPLVAKGQMVGVLEIFHRTRLDPGVEWQDFLEALASQTAIAIDHAQLFDSLQRSNTELMLAYDATIEGWSHALDLRDRETEGHTRRVAEMTVRLAQSFGVSDAEQVHVRRGALLHDIGKIGVPDAILLKPGPLSDEEWQIIHKHPQLAYDMLAHITYLQPALDIPFCHHEKWDGAGYPRGLKGAQIPLAARIFAVVDVWDALTSDRPYRPAWTTEKALEYIRAQSGKHFDPQVVEAFMKGVGEE
ncbi:MAG: GAF domain-containing protein [Anaerolineales bacterium]|nr:GAF domain-containing protein [Anaerolineales bacterium]